MNKLEKVALRSAKKTGRPLVLIINNIHWFKNDDEGKNMILQLQQRGEAWAELYRLKNWSISRSTVSFTLLSCCNPDCWRCLSSWASLDIAELLADLLAQALFGCCGLIGRICGMVSCLNGFWRLGWLLRRSCCSISSNPKC